MYRATLKERVLILTGILILIVTIVGCQEADTLIESAFPDITVTHFPEPSDSDNIEDEQDLKPEAVRRGISSIF